MEIIDFHAHIYPDKIAEKATLSTGEFYGIKPEHIGTADELLTIGRQAGISRFVLLPIATKPEQVRHINDFIVREVNAHEEFYGFGTVHPDCEDLQAEAENILRLGLKGIKLHPDTQGFNIDDERFFEMYDTVQGRLPLLIHCGDRRFDYSHPRRLKRVIDNFPRLKIIAAHLGGWSMFDEAYELLSGTDCYIDISSCSAALPPERIGEYIHAYGAERILFGTDFPLWDPVSEVKLLDSLRLTDSELEQITSKNAHIILD